MYYTSEFLKTLIQDIVMVNVYVYNFKDSLNIVSSEADMAHTMHVEGYDNLQKVLQDNQGQTIFVVFTGSNGPDGNSWCPDCVKGILFIIDFDDALFQVACLKLC